MPIFGGKHRILQRKREFLSSVYILQHVSNWPLLSGFPNLFLGPQTPYLVLFAQVMPIYENYTGKVIIYIYQDSFTKKDKIARDNS